MRGTALFRWYTVAAAMIVLLYCSLPLFSAPAPPAGTVVLDELANLYQEVEFDHALHDSYASCVECHHHLTGEPSSNPACVSCHREGTTARPLGCRACHPANRYADAAQPLQVREAGYHIDTPGLIGAYHLRCVNCHLSITAGPTGCAGCHSPKSDALQPEKHE